MNEFGIDTSFGNIVPDSALGELKFGIFRIGTLGYAYTGTPTYYTKQLSIDSGFLANMQKFISNEIPAGVYIFSYAWDVESAQHEADVVCDALATMGISPTFPVFFDWEEDSRDKVSAAGVSITPELVFSITKAFCDRVSSRGFRAGWYNNPSFLSSYFTQTQISALRVKYYLWVASWGAASPGYACDLWQYQGTTAWNGISVDFNRVQNDRIFVKPLSDTIKLILELWIGKRRYKFTHNFSDD